MDEKFLETASIEELFQDYIKMYGPKLEDKAKYQDLIDALRDAFFAGMAIGDVSTKSHTIELLMYIKGTRLIKLNKTTLEGREEYIN